MRYLFYLTLASVLLSEAVPVACSFEGLPVTLPYFFEIRSVNLNNESEYLLVREFPEYHIPTFRDYGLMVAPRNVQRTLELEMEVARRRDNVFRDLTSQRLPFICWGDFDGNDRLDVALILLHWTSIQSPDSDISEIVVVILDTEQGYEAYKVASGPKMVNFGSYVFTDKRHNSHRVLHSKSDLWRDEKNPEIVKLENNGLIHGIEGKLSKTLIYYENGEFKQTLIDE